LQAINDYLATFMETFEDTFIWSLYPLIAFLILINNYDFYLFEQNYLEELLDVFRKWYLY